MANAFVHVELHTGDVAKAKQFYSKLFGWKLEDMPMPGGGTYTMIQVGEGTGGGMMSAQPPGSPPRWQAYVGVSLPARRRSGRLGDRKSTRLNSSHVAISYAVFCLKKKNKK